MTTSSTDTPLTAGVSINSQTLDLVLVDASGDVASTKKAELQTDRSIADQIHELIIENDSAYGAIGISVPGLVNADGKVLESRLPQLVGIDLQSELGEIVDGHVVVENDANAAAFAEWTIGAGEASKDLFRISIGEGVGAGFILDGKLWRGSHRFAGEIGSIVIDEEDDRLEDIASVSSIVRRTRNRFHQDKTSVLNKLNENEIGLSDIMSAAANGDDLALLMFERTGVAVGSAISAVINALNVELVVIGGELPRSSPILLHAIENRVRECTSKRIFESTSIQVSMLDDSAAAIGAALLANETK